MCRHVRELLSSGLCTLVVGTLLALIATCIELQAQAAPASGSTASDEVRPSEVRSDKDDATLRITVRVGNPGSEPVPLTLRRLDRHDPARVVVAEPGKPTDVELAPGTYQLTTSRSVVLNGQPYSWDLELPITGGVTAVELTEKNAFASQSEPVQPAPAAAQAPGPAPSAPSTPATAPPPEPAPQANVPQANAPEANSPAAQDTDSGQAETATLRVSLSSSLRSPKAKKIPIKLRRLDAREPSRTLLLNPAGSLHISLAPGRYQLLVDRPVSLGGKLYAWDIEVSVGNGASDVVLGEANALSMDRQPVDVASPDDERAEQKPVTVAAATRSSDGERTSKPSPSIPKTEPAVSKTATAPPPSAPAQTPAPQVSTAQSDGLQPSPPELTELINRWIASVKARDLETLMSCYAPVMDTYFLQDGVRWQAVRRDKQQFFDTYSDIRRLEIADLRFERNNRGVEATFRKMWDFTGNRTFSGEVVSRLTFKNVGGRWVIASERERLIWTSKSPSTRRDALSVTR